MDTNPLNPAQTGQLEGGFHSFLASSPLSEQQPSPADPDSNPSPQTWLDLFDQTAILYPEQTAISFWDQCLTYRELAASINRLTAYLQHIGVGPGDKVAMAIQRSPEMLIAMMAVLRAGACYIPIDPEYPRPRIEYMVEDSGASFLVLSGQFQDHFRSGIRRIILEEVWGDLSFFTTRDTARQQSGDSLAYIIYTSGSTGKPKGVQIEHHSLLNFLLGMRQLLDMKPGERMLALTTISFDIAALELYLPLISGAELVLADSITAKDARLLYDILRAKDINWMQATPSSWRLLLEVGRELPLPLKILCGGEALQQELAARLMARGKEVWNLYGPTETTVWSTAKKLQQQDEPVTIGRPILNTSVYILDDKHQPVAEGEQGEICIGGEGVARGYLNRPDQTGLRFLPDPYSNITGQRIYCTGDIGRILSNGEIQCLGRVDHQIKISGHRVEPAEIEEALRSLPGIHETLVIGKAEQLIAYLVCGPDPSRPGTFAMREHLRGLLPGFMIPHHFVILEKFPLTPNGKIDRQSLPDPQQTIGSGQILQKGQAERSGGIDEYEPPATPTEEYLARVWGEYIGVPDPARHDDFFESGGNSINALRIMSRIEKDTGRRLPLASLFQAPTIEKLAALLDAEEAAISWDPLVTIREGNGRKPVYIIQGHGMNVITFHNIARHMDPDQPVYGFQARGLNGVDSPLATIEEMAADYITSILRIDPSDTFCLAGYSYGGIIAFEMARQLEAMGKRIRVLAIVDTNVGWTLDTKSGFVKGLKKFRRQWPKLRFVAKGLRDHPRQVLDYQWQYLLGKTRAWGRFFSDAGPEERHELLATIDERYERACHSYRMTPYNGKVELFRVKTRLYYLDDLEYMGWRSYALQGVGIHEIDGDHKTFMLPPNDRSFAETLQRVLDDSIIPDPDI